MMDAADLILLGFKGVAIAALPVAAIWVGRASHGRGDRLRRLAWVTAFLTFDLIVFGGFTRLTDSGLGCPDWPGCYAKANPLMAAHEIGVAQAALPTGPVTMQKAWIEMIHRYLAMGVGVLIIAMLAISAWRARRAPRAAAHPRLVSGLLALVVVQGAFGAWTVTQKLQPVFVTVHLLLGLALLAGLLWHALRFERAARIEAADGRGWALATSMLLLVQVALGGWVSANYAVLACTDFPTCQGAWLPPMDFANAFHPWRELGRTAEGTALSLEALTAIHWAHRTFAALVTAAAAMLAWTIRREPALSTAARAIVVLIVAQCATGLINVVHGWPLVAAVLHNAGAAGLVACLTVINYRLSAGSGWRPAHRLHERTTEPCSTPSTSPSVGS